MLEYCYVLIELKITKLMLEAVGKFNMHINYYKMEVNNERDNDFIGIILCTNKKKVDEG